MNTRTPGMAQRARTLSATTCILLTGCTLGPDFHRPDAPTANQYTAAVQPAATVVADGKAQRFVDARDIPGDWWTLFHSPALDTLVRAALAGSPTIGQARARLAQAEENRNARASATTYPQIDGQSGIKRQQIDPAALGFPTAPVPPPFNLYNVGIDVSYTFDIFGGARRELEALGAQVDYAHEELDAARRTLAANVVTTALRAAALRAQIDITVAILDAQQQQLSIAERRFALGAVAAVDLDNQHALVAQTAATLPSIRALLAQSDHELAILLGEAPADALLPVLALDDFTLPLDIPLSLPSELARQRPDIRASEALLHQASANVGVATADLYPKVTLSGNANTTRTSFGDIANGINVWSIGLDLLQPIFRGGELRARQRAAIAAYDEALAAHRLAVLQALQNVADALRALEADAQTLAARDTEVARSESVYRITAERYRLGGVSQLALLDAQRQRLQAALDRQQAIAARFADTAALLTALGGGWWPEGETAAALPAPGGAATAPVLPASAATSASAQSSVR